jgi:Domain of unknown function (DUF1876)
MTGNDDGTETCQVDVLIEEHEERTRAKARLSWAGEKFGGVGLARRSAPAVLHRPGIPRRPYRARSAVARSHRKTNISLALSRAAPAPGSRWAATKIGSDTE